MATFQMPSLGADMESGILVEWKVGPGDAVHRGQVVAVVETDKGAIDVEIFFDGVIDALLVEPDTEVPVGAPLARLRVVGEAEPSATEPGATGPSVTEPSATEPSVTEPSATEPRTTEPSATVPSATETRPSDTEPRATRVKVAPRARKLAEELGVSLAGVVGTGPDGSVTADDVQRAAAVPATTPPAAAPGRAAGMRAAIAAAMSRSKREIPHYYLSHRIDMEAALLGLARDNESRPITERVLPVALLVRAVARALQEFPELCGWWRDGAFRPSEGIHVGLAVSLRDGGLVDPAIHHADRGSLVELFARIRDVTQRARTSQLRSSELSDAAITITSLGDQGVESVLGVIHPPQVAIVGFGSITPQPWVVDGKLEVRRVVTATLSADHRVSDGHRGARFLRSVEQHLQGAPST